jgi:predicted Rossmann fold flavoprotein
MTDWDAAIIGGGPAGLMAAIRASERGLRTILLDKNRRPGIKILLSGGTRCNLTHATDARGIIKAFGPAGRFLHSALAAFAPQQVVDWFEAEGVATKIEAGGKIFPASDRAADILNAMIRRLQRSGCTLATAEPLTAIERLAEGFRLVTPQRTMVARKVLLATGGQSYPACGTTGDGYRWAAELGHTIVTPRPALTPITSHAAWLLSLQGITLPDVSIKVMDPQASSEAGTRSKPICLAGQRGSLLFAHFGVSGPVILDVSRAVSGHRQSNRLVLHCDLLPDLREHEVETALAEQAAAGGRRRAASFLDPWMPHRLAEAVVEQAGIPAERTAAEFSKQERRRLAQTVKTLTIPVAGTMGFRKAEVTAGGVSLDEVDSHTLQSRILPGLFFAGELLNLDGPIGGYNFQAAFSTGRLAGENL